MELVKLIAWFWDNKEIQEFLKEKTGKSLATPTIQQYRETAKWQPIIEKLREDYNKAMYEVPLFHKRKRLDELQKHYEYHMRANKWRQAQAVIRDIKDEVEHKFGDVSFNFTQITQYNDMTDEQIAEEKGKILDQLDRAQKMKRLLENKGDTDGQE